MNKIILGFAIPVLACISSCGGMEGERGEGFAEKAEYEIFISGDDNRQLYGQDLESSQWKRDIGFIYLGKDKTIEPLGTLTMTLNVETSNAGDYFVTDVYLSVTDKRIGTSQELNARLYNTSLATIYDVEFGANYISGNLDMDMDMVEVVNSPNDLPLEVTVKGTFVAKTE